MMSSKCMKKNGVKIKGKEFFLWRHKKRKSNMFQNYKKSYGKPERPKEKWNKPEKEYSKLL